MLHTIAENAVADKPGMRFNAGVDARKHRAVRTAGLPGPTRPGEYRSTRRNRHGRSAGLNG